MGHVHVIFVFINRLQEICRINNNNKINDTAFDFRMVHVVTMGHGLFRMPFCLW